MKSFTLIATVLTVVFTLTTIDVTAQDFPPLDKSPMDAAAFPSDYKTSDKKVKIIYSRPSLRGRTLEKLTPNGEVWRTGANEAAEITFYDTMMFGDTKINAGTYSFFLIPGEQNWTAILNKEINIWGSYFYNEGSDVARIEVPITEDQKSIEAFSIVFTESKTGCNMHLAWGKFRWMIKIDNP